MRYSPTASAVIVAGGSGRRMGGDVKKQYRILAGHPVLSRTLSEFGRCGCIRRIYLVVPENDMAYCRRHVLPSADCATPIDLVAGGQSRQGSVWNGLCAVDEDDSVVVVHDGVRPFITAEAIAGCIQSAETHGACILGIPVSETLKRSDGAPCVTATVDRHGLWLAQTPQAFDRRLITAAHRQALDKGVSATDDAMLVERLGHPVRILPGSRFNIKITTPEDLVLAEAILHVLNTHP